MSIPTEDDSKLRTITQAAIVPAMCDTATFDSQDESNQESPPSDHCGRYSLERLLGSGGYGEVWKGTDPSLNRPVAIKRLRADRVMSPKAVEEFLEEGRKLALLSHIGVVLVYDAGVTENRPYIVSELITGGSLGGVLRQREMSVPETCLIIRELAETLHYVHARGIVHRDIKPQNILMEQGRPKLADFGLAISEFEQLSEQPAVVGTYAYMSPEQIRGDSHLVDGRSDIYSLGVVFYQMLTGRMPFLANSHQQLKDQILQREPRPVRSINEQVPPELEEICLKCLRKNISERYTTALDLAQDLKAYEETLIAPSSRKRMALWTALALVVLLTGAVSAAIYWPKENVRLPLVPGPLDQPAQKPPQPVKNLLGDLTLSSVTEYAVDPAGTNLSVTAFTRSLVSVGQTGEEDLDLEVSFSQPQWTGNIGIFFGYRPASDGVSTEYHALYMYKVGNDFYLRASVFYFRTEHPGGTHTNHLLPEWKIDNFQPAKNTIGIRIQNGQLSQIAFNGKLLKESLLLKMQKDFRPNEFDCQGAFGLLNINSAGRFQAPMINEEEILYTTGH